MHTKMKIKKVIILGFGSFCQLEQELLYKNKCVYSIDDNDSNGGHLEFLIGTKKHNLGSVFKK